MNPSFKKFISTKLFLAFGSLLLVFVLALVFKQWQQKYQIQKQINELSGQAAALNQKNQDLQNLLSYLQTPDYKEKAARQQLNLQRSGEVVYNFSAQDGPSPSGSGSGQGSASINQLLGLTNSGTLSSGSGTASAQNQNISNARKWWNYLFHAGH